jgi:hypothetical protein
MVLLFIGIQNKEQAAGLHQLLQNNGGHLSLAH